MNGKTVRTAYKKNSSDASRTLRRHTLMRELPKALTTTSSWKQKEGTRLIAVSNSNNVRDVQWVIRRLTS